MKTLPLGNIGATSRTLYEMLTQVNHLSLPVRARTSLLEQLHPVLRYTLAGLQRHYHGQPLPLPARTVLVAELAVSLLEEMARGYRIILVQSARQRVSRRLLARSFQRCGYYMGLALLESYATYLRAPKGLWRTFHALYAHAQSLRLEDVQVADAQPADGRSSLAVCYKQALLLAAAGPYRLRPQEIRTAHRLLSRVAGSCELKAGDELGLRGGFRFDSAGDTGPTTGPRGGAASSASERVLLTGPALARLQSALAPRRGWRFWAPPPAHEDADLIRRLSAALGEAPNRTLPRRQVAERAEIVIGLSAIHRRLAPGGAECHDMRATFDSREPLSASPKDDVWTMIFPRGEEAETESAVATAVASATSGPASPQQWQLVNASARGYCLVATQRTSARARVGELVAMRGGAPGTAWQLALVRWVQQSLPGELLVGVQTLGQNPRAVAICPGPTQESQTALLLPASDTWQGETLLVHAQAALGADRRVILRGDHDFEVLLTREAEATGVFSQFEFCRGRALLGRQFDSVWSSI